MTEKGSLHILDALENLNTLLDVDSLSEIEVTDDLILIPHKGEVEGERSDLYWVQAGPDAQTQLAIKDTFRSVLSYLKHFYTKMKKGGDTTRLVEGINTIMVLVGEAAKKLDRLGTLFKERVVEFDEYKDLQNFYRNRVIKESFQEFSKVPLIKKAKKEIQPNLYEHVAAEEELQELLGLKEIEEIAGVHILNDVDVIRRDHLYELFYLKNEAGHHFYTYELARNIKLACDFGEFAQEYFGDDPLLQIKNWEDKSLNDRAYQLLKICRHPIEKFYKEALKYKDMAVVATSHHALMALMLAANPRNLIRQFSYKGCHLYFYDFLLFLREVLKNPDYQKFLLYGAPAGKPFFQDLISLIHTLCYQLFKLPLQTEELKSSLTHIIEKEKHVKIEQLSDILISAHAALHSALEKHPNGPVFKALDIIRDEDANLFDPLHQGNIPEQQWTICAKDQEIAVIRMPCPIIQEMINKAYINQEFKTFLAALGKEERLLMINFQDRTSWKEHARSIALEELARHAEFAEQFIVVTLAKDTDFYNQTDHYRDSDDASIFMDHFYQHLNDESTGYYFPIALKKEFFPHFIEALLHQIHKTFFEEKEHLSYLQRLDFIELAYYLIELKLIEAVQPSLLCLGSKDGLDVTATTSVGLIALLTTHSKKNWQEKESAQLLTLLFGPTLRNRERVIHLERFERLHHMIQLLETKEDYFKAFSSLFKKATLDLTVKLI